MKPITRAYSKAAAFLWGCQGNYVYCVHEIAVY